MGRQFVEKWVLDGRTDSAERELDEVRSGYPIASFASQWFSGVLYATASAEFTTLLSLPSTRVFRLRRMIVDNDYAAPNRVRLYNYPSASTTSFVAVAMKIAGSQTEFVDNLDVPFIGGPSGCVYICTPQPSVWVRIQGILIASQT